VLRPSVLREVLALAGYHPASIRHWFVLTSRGTSVPHLAESDCFVLSVDITMQGSLRFEAGTAIVAFSAEDDPGCCAKLFRYGRASLVESLDTPDTPEELLELLVNKAEAFYREYSAKH